MKDLKLLFAFAALGAFVIIQGCNKELLPTSGGAKLKATKTQIGISEADTLLLTNALGTDSVKWTVSPAGKGYLRSRGNAATITFYAAGNYVVTAEKSGSLPESITLTVSPGAPADTVTTRSDVTTSTSDTLQLVPITNDVNLGVRYYTDPAGNGVVIELMPYVYLNNYYCRNAMIQFRSAITGDNNFLLDLINVRESKGCAIATLPTTSATGTTAAYDVFVKRALGQGTYPLKITVSGGVYTGSIVVSEANITFVWPYTSGVIIPRKVLPLK